MASPCLAPVPSREHRKHGLGSARLRSYLGIWNYRNYFNFTSPVWFPWQLPRELWLFPPYCPPVRRAGFPRGQGSHSSQGSRSVTLSSPRALPPGKAGWIHFSAILRVFCFVHVVNFALSKSPIITHSLIIFFKYYEKSSTQEEFFPLLRGGKGLGHGLTSQLWRSHDEGKMVGRLLGGMAGLAGASQVEVVGEGLKQLLLTPTPHTHPPAKGKEQGWERCSYKRSSHHRAKTSCLSRKYLEIAVTSPSHVGSSRKALDGAAAARAAG